MGKTHEPKQDDTLEYKKANLDEPSVEPPKTTFCFRIAREVSTSSKSGIIRAVITNKRSSKSDEDKPTS